MNENPFLQVLIPPKLSFSCLQCGEQFNVHLKYVSGKNSIVCPSCGQPLDGEAFAKLRHACIELESFLSLQNQRNEYPDKSESIKQGGKGFILSIDWKNKLPTCYNPSF